MSRFRTNEVVSANAEMKREELAERAASLIAQKGYKGCGVQDLIDHLGLSKGGFYWHFKSKEDLYVQVCRLQCGRARQMFFQMLRDQHAGLNGLVEASKELLRYFVDHPEHVKLLVGFHQEAQSELIRHELDGLELEWVRRMADAIRECGGVDDAEGVARQCVVFFEGLLLRLSLVGSPEWAFQQWDNFLRGVLLQRGSGNASGEHDGPRDGDAMADTGEK